MPGLDGDSEKELNGRANRTIMSIVTAVISPATKNSKTEKGVGGMFVGSLCLHLGRAGWEGWKGATVRSRVS